MLEPDRKWGEEVFSWDWEAEKPVILDATGRRINYKPEHKRPVGFVKPRE